MVMLHFPVTSAAQVGAAIAANKNKPKKTSRLAIACNLLAGEYATLYESEVNLVLRSRS